MRIVFMGSAELACPTLEALLDAGADEVVAVVTQPPRPRGRHLQAEPCPVMKQAVARGLRALREILRRAHLLADRVGDIHIVFLVRRHAGFQQLDTLSPCGAAVVLEGFFGSVHRQVDIGFRAQ